MGIDCISQFVSHRAKTISIVVVKKYYGSKTLAEVFPKTALNERFLIKETKMVGRFNPTAFCPNFFAFHKPKYADLWTGTS